MISATAHTQVPRSSIVRGVVRHWRAGPRQHAFVYPMVTLQLDVDTLPSTAISPFLFGVNRASLCSIRTDDFLEAPGSLRERVEAIMRRAGSDVSPARITLVTMPRIFGYVFNPVTFLIAFDAHERVLACVTQVHNTFGETHLYPLVCQPSNMPVSWRFPKRFYVSPFFDTEGEYTVVLNHEGHTLSVEVHLSRDETRVFSASFEGTARPLTRVCLLATLARYPLTLILTMTRIHVQAIILFFKARAIPFDKPMPTDPYTIRSRQNTIHRLRLWFLSVLKSSRHSP